MHPAHRRALLVGGRRSLQRVHAMMRVRDPGEPGPYLIRLVCAADGRELPHSGQFLKSFDHEAHDGRGEGEFTTHIGEAMEFPSLLDAMEFWRKVPKCRPKREDGRPNRPLTATTCEFSTKAQFLKEAHHE